MATVKLPIAVMLLLTIILLLIMSCQEKPAPLQQAAETVTKAGVKESLMRSQELPVAADVQEVRYIESVASALPPPQVVVVPAPPENQAPTNATPNVAPEVDLQVQQLDRKVAELLSRHKEIVKSYQYQYSDFPSNMLASYTFTGNFFVKGSKLKIELLAPNNDISQRSPLEGVPKYRDVPYDEDYFEFVYLDLSKHTAVGLCESNRCRNRYQPVKVRYNDFFRRLPSQWIEEVTYAELLEERQVQDRSVAVIGQNATEQYIKLFIDQYSGIPVMVELVNSTGNKTIIRYDNFAINAVSEADVTPPVRI